MKTPITEEQVTRYLGVRLLLVLGTFCGVTFGECNQCCGNRKGPVQIPESILP